MKKTDLAYIAGIVDGEGTIGIHRAKRRGPGNSWTYSLRVSVSMTEAYLPEWLKMAFGGNTYGKLRDKPRWKPQTEWVILGEKATGFLGDIMPYLIIKKPQAELAFKFLAIRAKGLRSRPFERYQQQLYWEEMRRLNQRGKNGGDNPGNVSGLRDVANAGEPGTDD